MGSEGSKDQNGGYFWLKVHRFADVRNNGSNGELVDCIKMGGLELGKKGATVTLRLENIRRGFDSRKNMENRLKMNVKRTRNLVAI